VTDPAVVVVDGERKVVGGVAVGLQQHVVVQGLVAKHHRAHHQVVQAGGAFRRHPLPDDKRLAGSGPARGLFRRDGRAPPVVALGLPASSLLRAHQFQAFRRAKTAVGRSPPDQLIRRASIDLLALRLHDRLLVPVETQPSQCLLDLLLAPWFQTRSVGVLDSKQELTPALPGKEEIE